MNIPFTVRDLAEWKTNTEPRIAALEAAVNEQKLEPGVTTERPNAVVSAVLDRVENTDATMAELRERLELVEAQLREQPWQQETPNPLSAVDFASDQAAELAADSGLTEDDFAGHNPTGANSAFNIADVRAVVAAKNTSAA